LELLRNRNSVYQIGYHIVWCIKYRRPVLAGQVADDVKELLLRIAKEGGFAIEQMEVMPDHVHLFITATPNHLIVDMVKALKGVSARFLFKKHPELKKTVMGWPSLESVVLRWRRRSHIRRNRQKLHRKPKGW